MSITRMDILWPKIGKTKYIVFLLCANNNLVKLGKIFLEKKIYRTASFFSETLFVQKMFWHLVPIIYFLSPLKLLLKK